MFVTNLLQLWVENFYYLENVIIRHIYQPFCGQFGLKWKKLGQTGKGKEKLKNLIRHKTHSSEQNIYIFVVE